MKKNSIIIISIISILILGILAYSFFNKQKAPVEFAQCLTEKGFEMYGTEWCPHCKAQKKMFGDSFKYILYTDCDKNKDICLREGIKGYPTWKLNNESYPGTQELEKLGEISGCQLNN